MNKDFGFEVFLPLGFDETVAVVTETLKEEGFGIISTVNVQETLKNKIDVDILPCVLLGACNPHIAYKALQGDPASALMMPCTVMVEETSGGSTAVRLTNPAVIKMVVDEVNEHISEAAETGSQRMMNVFNKLQTK